MPSGEEFTDCTYWNPYSRKQEPCLTEEQVQSMWPYNKRDNHLDDAMPNLPPRKDTRPVADEPREEAVHFEWPLDAGVPTDNDILSKEDQGVQLNLLTAEDRCGKDNVVLPEHYARFKIEPIRFVGENKLDFFQGNIIKYVCRWDAKNGLEDLDKVIRYANMYRRYAEGDPDWWKAGKPEDFKLG